MAEERKRRARDEEENTEVRRTVPKATRNPVEHNKRSKFQTFVDEDLPILWDSVKERAIPSLLDTAFDMGKFLLETAIYGKYDDDRYYSRRSSSRRQDYTRYSKRGERYGSSSRTREAGSPRSRYDVDQITFKTRDDADRVLDIICEELEEYDFVSVGTYYSACDISPHAGDFNYGWYDLRNARVENRRGRWIISMPRCVERED